MSEPQRHPISDFIGTAFVWAFVIAIVLGVVVVAVAVVAWLISLVEKAASPGDRNSEQAVQVSGNQLPSSIGLMLPASVEARNDVTALRPTPRSSKRIGWLWTGLILCLFGVYVMATDGGDQRAAGSIFYLVSACWFCWRLSR